MEEFWLVLPIGLIAVPLLLYLRGGQRTAAGGLWAGGWLALWLSGLSTVLAHRWPAADWLSHLSQPAFAVLMYAGARSFADRPVTRRSWLWVPAIAGLRVGLAAAGQPLAAVVAGSLLQASLLLAAAAVLWSYVLKRRPLGAQHAVVFALLALAAIEAVDWVGDRIGGGAEHAVLGVWLTLAVLTLLFQLLAVAERGRERERLLRQERELLRRVAAAVSNADDPYAALARVGAGINFMGRFPIFGIWVRSRDGSSYELLEHPELGDGVPEDMRRVPRSRSLVQTLETMNGPVFLDDLASDPRLSEGLRSLGARRAVAAAIRHGSRTLGILGGAIRGEAPLGAEARQFIGDLVDELGVILSNLHTRSQGIESARDLAVERSTLAALVEAVPVGILLADPEGRVRLMNQRLADDLGVGEAGRWTGRLAREVLAGARERLAPEARGLVADGVARFAADRARVADGVQIRLRDEGPGEAAAARTLQVDARPVRDAAGGHVGRVWVTRDVTQERALAEAVQRTERLESIGALAGGIAHDFNNQLTAILGNARLAADDLPSGHADARLLREIELAAERCADRTRELLAFAGHSASQPRPTDVAEAVEEAVREARASRPPGVRVELDLGEGDAYVAADPADLRRLVADLIAHAHASVARGGRIDISLARLSAAGEAEPGSVELCVRDDGPALAETVRRRLFEPFSVSLPGGSRLGLAVAHGIVHGQRGTIDAEASSERGNALRVRWPAAPPPPARVLGASAGGAPRRAGALVLVAEDEAAVRRLARKALERAGYRVLEAADGDAAIALFERCREEVALALCDLSMPGATGLDVIAALRELAPDLPALVMSGHPERERTAAWPPDVQLLAKPFGPRALLARVDGLLSGAS